MNLQHISDNNLRIDSKRAAAREKLATVELLHHIREVDQRRLYCDWKFTSLFDWCVRDLALCEGSAQLRITAARLLQEMPEVEGKIRDGTLSLSNIAQVNHFCREHRIEGAEEKKKLLKEVENLTKKQAELRLFQISGKERPAQEGKIRVSETMTKVTLLLSNETMEALEEVKALLGKEVSMDELVGLMAKALKEKVEKEKFKQVEKPRASRGTKVGARVISAEVKREVYARDRKCVNCGSKHRLNFDHRHPYSMGGDNTAGNIRLLCFNCNQRAWVNSSG